MKRCGTCKELKLVSQFGKNRAKGDGLQGTCKDCRKIRDSAFYQRTKVKFGPLRKSITQRNLTRKRYFLAEYLLSHPCVDCGETDIVVLQFDHLRDKSMSIGDMVGGGLSWERILAEIEKCEVVCANDHARRTAKAFGWFKSTLASSKEEHSALNGGVGMSEFPRGTD